jgi:hypothetical protein
MRAKLRALVPCALMPCALIGAGLLLAGAPVSAHHAFGAEFDIDRPITLKGMVTKMEWVNPHSWIHLDVKDADGKVTPWMIEGGSPNSLLRLGFTMNAVKYGMEIVVDGYQAKDGANRGVGVSLTFTDGKKLFLGSNAPGGKGHH